MKKELRHRNSIRVLDKARTLIRSFLPAVILRGRLVKTNMATSTCPHKSSNTKKPWTRASNPHLGRTLVRVKGYQKGKYNRTK